MADLKNLAVIRLWYEGNAFSPVEATQDDFEAREWVCASEAKTFYQGTNVEIAALESFAQENPDIATHYIFCAAAYPSGPMQTGLFRAILDRIEMGLSKRHWQGVYLSLHGSAVTRDEARAETILLRRVREIVGANTPIAASFDLHANLNPAIGNLVDITCGYKTYPHIDMQETGAKALALLGRAMAGEITPVTTIVPAGFAPTSFNMRSSHAPMADIIAQAKKLEQENNFYDVSAYGGFVYADTVDTGASISICADRQALLEGSNLASFFRARAPQFDIGLPAAAQTLASIKQALKQDRHVQPIAIIEPSDNIFSGGGADTPGLLAAALESGIEVPSLFAFFWDPQVVQQAIETGVGGNLDIKLGGRLTREFGPPVELSVQVEKLTDGEFTNLGPMEVNLQVNLGATVLLKKDLLHIIVTSKNVPVNDRAYFDLHGLELDDFVIIYVKAKNHFKSAFEDKFAQIIEVETPGPAASDLAAFSFTNLPGKYLNTKIMIKTATIDDAGPIAAMHTSSWRDVYANILPKKYLSDEIEQERNNFWRHRIQSGAQSDMILTIKSGDNLMGFIWTSAEGEPGYDAVIEALHVDPNARGCGYGKQLMKAAVEQLINKGDKSICLRVFDANTAAFKFYQQLGGLKDQSGVDSFSGANAPDSRIGWKDITVLRAALS
ncbi:MAG: GNAT family N-acetyltransferase [Gammaproteobacteria bacterium]|nr:GNAT family N-acetyltransferase [Gammaproteobacteria bacterium]